MVSQNDGNTIFLTEQEAERIQKTVRERLKECAKLAGNSREPRVAKDAISQATGASLMADMGGAPDPDMAETKGRGGALPALAVGQPYAPCVQPLSYLEPMKFDELRMETHHRGRRLMIRRASPVVTLAARSWTMVQDEAGKETERLEVCLHKTKYGEDLLESSRRFAVKEPYFTLTEQGEPTIRIDHPSDLVVLDDEIVAANEEDAAKLAKAAKSCKDQGNTALKQQDLPLAYEKYTLGMKIAQRSTVRESNPDLVRDIARNRAHLNLLLSQLDEAMTDAKIALIYGEDQRSKDLDAKAYFRIGCAAYNLGEYEDATGFFQAQQKLAPADKDAKANLKRIETRQREQKNGVYDLMSVRARLSQARPRADVADSTKNTQIKDSPGRGRGLYAARDIAAGEVIMAEKAFCVVYGHEGNALTAMTFDVRDDRIRVSPVGLSKAIVQKLISNPSQIPRVMDLFGDYQGEGKQVNFTEDGAVVDVFRIQDIVSRNAFGLGSQFGEEGASNASTGLWTHVAYMNHSCIANADKEPYGDLMVLRANKPIASGEEIFQCYLDSPDYEARQKALMTTWGFECACPLCVAEKADDPAVRDKRRELTGEADGFVSRKPWSDAKRPDIAKAKRIAQAIDETYDAKRYEGVPRVASNGIKEWIAKAERRR